MSETREMETSPAAYLGRLVDDMYFLHTIFAAAQLGIADLLNNGPRSIADLAEATGTHALSLYRLLRALASRGVFHEDADGRFSLTSLAGPLRRDAPDSVHNSLLLAGNEANLRMFANLAYSVRTGQPAFEHLYGKAWYDYLDEQPELAQVFNTMMTNRSTRAGAAIVDSYDFSRYRRIVDLGGGQGALLARILDRNATVSGVLFDTAQVIASAQGAIDKHVAQGRAEKVAGDFFQAVPQGGDAYVLRFIVHDWDDEHAVTILKNCRQAMAEKGRVLLVELVIPTGNEPSPVKFIDLIMLLTFHGRERTVAEYRDLLRQAGLQLVKIIPAALPFNIIEAVSS